MNEELEKQLARVVEKAIEAAEKTGEFVIDQAPELLREFYMWHIINNALFLLIGLALIFSGWKFFRAFGKKNPFTDLGSEATNFLGRYYSTDEWFGVVMSGVFTSVPGIIVSVIYIRQLLYVIVAPKLYLIDYFI